MRQRFTTRSPGPACRKCLRCKGLRSIFSSDAAIKQADITYDEHNSTEHIFSPPMQRGILPRHTPESRHTERSEPLHARVNPACQPSRSWYLDHPPA